MTTKGKRIVLVCKKCGKPLVVSKYYTRDRLSAISDLVGDSSYEVRLTGICKTCKRKKV